MRWWERERFEEKHGHCHITLLDLWTVPRPGFKLQNRIPGLARFSRRAFPPYVPESNGHGRLEDNRRTPPVSPTFKEEKWHGIDLYTGLLQLRSCDLDCPDNWDSCLLPYMFSSEHNPISYYAIHSLIIVITSTRDAGHLFVWETRYYAFFCMKSLFTHSLSLDFHFHILTTKKIGQLLIAASSFFARLSSDQMRNAPNSPMVK